MKRKHVLALSTVVLAAIAIPIIALVPTKKQQITNQPTTSLSSTTSPDQTTIIAPSTALITDASGNTWGITTDNHVIVNGTSDTATKNVAELAYVSGNVWQENSSGTWWYKTSPTATWMPKGGTTTSPLMANNPPTVSAGSDQTITLPTNTVTLNGSASDSDGTISSYSWSKVSGGSATINSPSAATTTITNLVQGTYVFKLTATDNLGAMASDNLTVKVNAATTNGQVTKIITFIEENHSLAEMKSQMPYLYSQAIQYGYADHYTAMTHPSLPNYLSIASGSYYGISDDATPAVHPVSGASIFSEAINAGKTARSYMESMPSNCTLTNSGSYVVKHNPWAYFVDDRANCKLYDLPAGSVTSGNLYTDIVSGSLPTISVVSPNVDHDAHDGTLAQADTWIKSWIQLIYNSPDWKSGHLAIVVTADEDDKKGDNTVLTVVMHPSQNNHLVSTSLTHYSLARLFAELSGTTPLRNAASAPDMAAAFGLSF